MTKPPKKKRSRSEVAEERVVAAEVMLRRAALAYAKVAELDPSDPRWRRCWRAGACGVPAGRGALSQAGRAPPGMAKRKEGAQSARPVSLLLGLAGLPPRADRRGGRWRARLALARPALFRFHRRRERIREARRA